MPSRSQEVMNMDMDNQVLMMLGEIRGELVEIRKLSERVGKLEQWQAWLKGGWAAIMAAVAYLFRSDMGK